MNQEEFDTISAAMCSYVANRQLNGEPEKKRSDLISSMKHLLKGKEMYNELTLFMKIKKANASSLSFQKKKSKRCDVKYGPPLAISLTGLMLGKILLCIKDSLLKRGIVLSVFQRTKNGEL
jgi:hypothetical protein